MKKFFPLFLLLYVFGVALRIGGQLLNKQPINWKSTLSLGEFDNTQDFGQRWQLRIAIMIALPFVWIYLLNKKWIG